MPMRVNYSEQLARWSDVNPKCHSSLDQKVGKALHGAYTLLINANRGKSSQTTGKEVRCESKMSSIFSSKGGGIAKIL